MPANRLTPLSPPYSAEVARTLERMMPPGMEPLRLFRTVAHNPHVLDKLRSTGAYLLNFGSVEPRDRELVIHRICARCRCEYEWGVHVTVFARPLGFDDRKIAATLLASHDDPIWSEHEALLVRFADELHETANVSDGVWAALRERFSDVQIVELVALAGQYEAISYLANVLGVEREESAERFPAARSGGAAAEVRRA
jgi:4-carboxymuconolactone decarboxylase